SARPWTRDRCSMNEVVREWIDKAQADYLTATREGRADPPNYDAVCFHAQQCAEKLMKAAIMVKGQVPAKTHDPRFSAVCSVP
ncbi:MAG TPA: HEPN domain-containing protein, partial [Sedimentisphaerales bacterium]|nr:HEPN domain-containing protein [Sedimentisphaerales bacterium]